MKQKDRAEERYRKEDIEEESIEEIKKKIKKDGWNHPGTVIPLGLSAVSLIFAATGIGLPITLLTAGGSLGFGVLFRGWHWKFREEKYLEEKGKELAALQEKKKKEKEKRELVELRQKVFNGFKDLNSKDGLKALEELVYEFEELWALLERLPAGQSFVPMDRICKSAVQTYHQGLSVLHDVLEIMRVVRDDDQHKLEQDITVLTREIADLERTKAKPQSIELKRQMVESHRERLARITNQRPYIEQLLNESDRCEAALQKVRIDLPILKRQASSTKMEESIGALEFAIEYARKVQEKIKESSS